MSHSSRPEPPDLTSILPSPNKLSLFIVLILVPLTNLSCLVLRAVLSAFNIISASLAVTRPDKSVTSVSKLVTEVVEALVFNAFCKSSWAVISPCILPHSAEVWVLEIVSPSIFIPAPAVSLFCFLASSVVRVVELTFLSSSVFMPSDVTGLLELAVGVISKVNLSCLVLSPFSKSVVLAFVSNTEFILVISVFICVSS